MAFSSLQLTSPTPCRPFDVARDGISIGEAGGIRASGARAGRLGRRRRAAARIGESSDAYHMSAPHPGVSCAPRDAGALAAAALEPGDIDYINLHGTGTPATIARKSGGHQRIRPDTPCSSTKGATGHTLGAAGALEAVISALAVKNGLMRAGVHTSKIDPTLTAHYIRDNRRAPVARVISNSFGFGGSNCSLILGRAG